MTCMVDYKHFSWGERHRTSECLETKINFRIWPTTSGMSTGSYGEYGFLINEILLETDLQRGDVYFDDAGNLWIYECFIVMTETGAATPGLLNGLDKIEKARGL